jgi:alcohol dehydrogenase
VRQLTITAPGEAKWVEVAEPWLEEATDSLVRPIAVARCDVDLPMAQGRTPFAPPIAAGHEFVAEVVEVGSRAEGVKPGQRVIVPFQISCGACERCGRGVTNSCLAVPPRSQYGFGARGGEWGGALSDLVRVPFAAAMLVPLPAGVNVASIASADNLCDGWRTVGPQLAERPGAEVLVVGGGALSVALYAVAVAKAMGSARVDYIDVDGERLDLAQSLGASVLQGSPPERLGPYPITVDASADPAGLACALRSTEPGGVCTSVGIYFAAETPVPLLEMYATGITFKTGRVNARAELPHVLRLIESGKLQPERVTTRTVGWEEAVDAWLEPAVKLVVLRDGLAPS